MECALAFQQTTLHWNSSFCVCEFFFVSAVMSALVADTVDERLHRENHIAALCLCIAALFANALTFAQWLSLRDVDSLPRNAFCAFCLAMFGALPFLSVAQYFCRALRLCRTNKAAVKAPMTRILRAPNCSFHKKCPQRRTAMPKMRRSASSPLRRGCRSRRSLCGTHSLRFAQCANFETFFVF